MPVQVRSQMTQVARLRQVAELREQINRFDSM